MVSYFSFPLSSSEKKKKKKEKKKENNKNNKRTKKKKRRKRTRMRRRISRSIAIIISRSRGSNRIFSVAVVVEARIASHSQGEIL